MQDRYYCEKFILFGGLKHPTVLPNFFLRAKNGGSPKLLPRSWTAKVSDIDLNRLQPCVAELNFVDISELLKQDEGNDGDEIE